jgi:hypothetical protein
MRAARLLVILAVAIIACVAPPIAGAQGVGPDANGGGATIDNEAKAKEQEKKKDEDFGDKCRPGVPGINEIADAACDVAKTGQEQVTGAPGKIAGKVVGGALDQATEWMTDAAVWTTRQIAAGIKKTGTPELQAGWYRERFAEMVALGMGLAALVTLMALVSAAIRRDPEALGATVYGMLRAGLGTGLVLVLTVLALGIADQISNAFVSTTAGGFWRDVGEAWGDGNFAGFGSSAIAFLFALIQVLAGLAVWIEMLLRSAAIEEWTPLTIRFLLGRFSRRARFRAQLAQVGHVVRASLKAILSLSGRGIRGRFRPSSLVLSFWMVSWRAMRAR